MGSGMERSTSNDYNRAQKALTHPRQLQATLNVIPAYTWYAASSGGLTFVNKRTADYLGLPKDHPLRLGIDIDGPRDAHLPFLHPDDREETRKVWLTCLRTGEAGEVSFRVRNAQGGYRWFLSRAEPLRASDGTLLLWVGVSLDIEELKRAQASIAEARRELRQMIDTIPIPVASYGADARRDFVNAAWKEYTGLSDEAALGTLWSAVAHPDHVAPGDEMWRDALARQIARVRAYIDSNLHRTIHVRDLSAVARRSPAHFSRKFKSAFGEPPHAYVVRRRLEKACHRMMTSAASLSEIALSVGFSDQAHLCRLFRQAYGRTPNSWRREYNCDSDRMATS
jgi:PAS domain S-box-containing protein